LSLFENIHVGEEFGMLFVVLQFDNVTIVYTPKVNQFDTKPSVDTKW